MASRARHCTEGRSAKSHLRRATSAATASCCVFVFARNRKVQLEYVAESILLAPDGRIESSTDLLVTNKSPQPITKLELLYPHAYPVINQDGRPTMLGELDDATHLFLRPRDSLNALYNLAGNRMSVESDGDPDPILRVYQPDPSCPSRMLDYQGRVVVPAGLTTAELSPMQFSILEALGWSIFEWDLRKPLECNDRRWLRLHTRPLASAVNRRTAWRRFLRMISGRLRYSYEIFSPADVLYRFDVALSSLVHILEPRDYIQAKLLRAATGLRQEWIEPALAEGTETHICDWRIHVFPRRLGRLAHADRAGDVVQAGGIPNFVRIGPREVIVYEWKAGKVNVPEQRHNGKFTISIEASYDPAYLAWLRWIPLPIAVWWLVERLANLIAR